MDVMDVSIREATSTPFIGPRGVDEVGGGIVLVAMGSVMWFPRWVEETIASLAEFITLRSAATDG